MISMVINMEIITNMELTQSKSEEGVSVRGVRRL